MRVMRYSSFTLFNWAIGTTWEKKTQIVINLARNFYTISTTDLRRAEFLFAFIFQTLESPLHTARVVSITPQQQSSAIATREKCVNLQHWAMLLAISRNCFAGKTNYDSGDVCVYIGSASPLYVSLFWSRGSTVHLKFPCSRRYNQLVRAQIAFSPWNALLTWRTYLLAHFRSHKEANGHVLLIMERDFLDASSKLQTHKHSAAFMALSRFFSLTIIETRQNQYCDL